MEWFNVFGLIFMVLILIPILYLRLSAKMALIISGTINMLRSWNKLGDLVVLDL